MDENWIIVLAVTLVVVITLGVVLATHHLRWRRALREQLELGNIDQEQYERMK
jgi:hypothetical protein